ncbi:RCC1 domain-containing protein [Nonomuraea sp. CA-141351]|uniref:RCC1 domain-containing protein n=1 Tax=Nonomuraea sp. CA-141351 TaxID=3239996 RepID=UPI003D8CDDA0
MRWLIGLVACAVLAGLLSLDKASAAFRAITSTTGTWTSAAVYPGGNLSDWGQNSSGQLGIGSTTDSPSPVHVGSATTWAKPAAGGAFACAVRTDGTLWCWGDNSSGQLGLGDTTNRTTPAQVGTLTTWSLVSAGGAFACAVRTNGTLWCWGDNSKGQLGLGDLVNRTSPAQVGTLTTWQSVSTGKAHACGWRDGNTLWCWGDNSSGQLGLGNAINRRLPAEVLAIGPTNSVSAGGAHTCAVRVSQSLWCWGNNASGQLGLGDTSNRLSPVQVGTLNVWEVPAATGGAHTCARQIDTTLWCWGDNSSGQLGLGDTTNRTSPVQVTTPGTWSAVTAGAAHTCGKRTTGNSVWCWGNNSFGQLGLGDHTNRKTPAQLSGFSSISVATGPTAFFTLAAS